MTTAEEIRAHAEKTFREMKAAGSSGRDVAAVGISVALQLMLAQYEIAAQLAELNQNFRMVQNVDEYSDGRVAYLRVETEGR